MAWTASNPFIIGNSTKKSDVDKVWDNINYLHGLTFVSDVAAAGTDTYTVAASPALAAYTAGAFYYCIITNANTSTTPTINWNSLGAKTIKKHGGLALAAGDISAAHAVIFRYDGTDMILCNPKVTIYTHPNHTGEVTSSGDGATTIAAGVVSQSKLKTSQGSVSVVVGAHEEATTASPPGGEYGFACQVMCSATVLEFMGFYAASAPTSYALPGGRFNNTNDNARTGYVQQRYISASGRDHWIFVLVNKTTRAILAAYEAPDHPSANSQALHVDIPHPFGSYDPEQHDIVLLDNDVLLSIKPYLTRRTGILDVINQRGVVDDAVSATYQAREIRKINEYPDDPYPGNFRTEVLFTPQWAKILIKEDIITLETFAIETLPENIQYRKLHLNKK